jgi:hypothetical protein
MGTKPSGPSASGIVPRGPGRTGDAPHGVLIAKGFSGAEYRGRMIPHKLGMRMTAEEDEVRSASRIGGAGGPS